MKVKLAKTAGFCMGVRRAMNIVLDAANKKQGRLYTHGPLVHNPQAIEMLRQKGVEILEEAPVSDATVIIRAHGITPEERRKIKESGNLLCDATCPHVAKAQAIIKKEIRKGRKAIIIGDKGHAEVNGLLGFANGKGFVVENTADVDDLPEIDMACIIGQTTQDRKVFWQVVEKLREKIPDCSVFDTICDSTNMRQNEVVKLAKEVDAMVIVGGKNSANTRRLYEISLDTGTPSYHIEDESELDNLGLEKYGNVGVMAGASTPNWVINKVIDKTNLLLQKKRSGLFRLLESIGSFLIESSLFLSLGAVSMCYTSLLFQDIRPSAIVLAITFLYVFAVHVFNRYNEKMKDEFFDPARTRFFKDYGKPLITAASISLLTALYLAYLLGTIDFVLLLFSCLMGILYSIRIVPGNLKSFTRYERFKDIPGSKDIFVSLAWAWVIVLIPFVSHGLLLTYESVSIFMFVVLTVFIRSVIFDAVSIEGDRIVGRETIPILIGRENTQTVLMILTVILGVFLASSASFGIIKSLAYYLVFPPVLMLICYYIFQKQRIKAGKLFEALIDTNFIFAGIIAHIWRISNS